MTATLPVLLYHSVTPTPAPGLERFTVRPEQLAEHLDLIAHLGLAAVPFGRVVQHLRTGTPLPERAVAITFDDGLADFAEHAWPRLRDRGMPATLFAVAGYLGGQSSWLPGRAGALPMLSARQLAELAEDGVDIGAHSMTHPQLDQIPRARARREIAGSKDALEQVLGRPVTAFAYPHGHHTRAVKELVVAAGFTSAAAVRNMFSHSRDDVYAVARLTVTEAMTTADIGRLLRGRDARPAPGRELLRTRAGRQIRRVRHITRRAA